MTKQKQTIEKQWTRAEFDKNIQNWSDEEHNICGTIMSLYAMCTYDMTWEDFYHTLKDDEVAFMRPAARVLWRTVSNCPTEPKQATMYVDDDDKVWDDQPVEITGEDRDKHFEPKEKPALQIADENYAQEILKETIEDAKLADTISD